MKKLKLQDNKKVIFSLELIPKPGNCFSITNDIVSVPGIILIKEIYKGYFLIFFMIKNESYHIVAYPKNDFAQKKIAEHFSFVKNFLREWYRPLTVGEVYCNLSILESGIKIFFQRNLSDILIDCKENEKVGYIRMEINDVKFLKDISALNPNLE